MPSRCMNPIHSLLMETVGSSRRETVPYRSPPTTTACDCSRNGRSTQATNHRRLGLDLGALGRDPMAGVVPPGKPREDRLSCPGPDHLLDDVIIADHRRAANRGNGEAHLLVKPLAQRDPVVVDLAP